MLIINAKMQQFNKVVLNIYQNSIFTNLINITVEGFEDLKS
jgi:hypothetical protein